MHIGLLGNPNVGKSVLFSRLTGVGVISSNYPGTTVEFLEGTVLRAGVKLHIHDLPGTYSLSGDSEDELVAIRMMAEDQPDAILAVVDATRLEQGMVLVFQIMELGYPVVLALNFMDVAKRRMNIDLRALEEALGVPVVPTVATTGEGLDEIADLLARGKARRSDFRVRYDRHIEEYLEELAPQLDEEKLGFPPRGALLKLMEGNPFFTERFPDEVKRRVEGIREEFLETHGETIDVHINRDLYGEAGKLMSEVVEPLDYRPSLSERVSDLTLRMSTGIPIMLLVLGGIFVSVIYVGAWLDGVLMEAYAYAVGDAFESLGEWMGGDLGMALAMGVDQSIQAIISLVIPYIVIFYLILGVLEDTGYLPRVVVLLDGLMHKLGLHGRAIIPMIVGLGCNVPAIMGTRAAGSKRERLILSTIIVMAVPCSAQTAIIMGTVGKYSGPLMAALIYLILLGLILLLGNLMHRFIRFEPTDLALEIPELALPRARNVLFKTWSRAKEFFLIAFPLLVLGSVVIEILLTYDALDPVVDPLSFITVGLLGLPAVTIVAFMFGVLRKEMALGLLITLLGAEEVSELGTLLTADQFFVFALVMATYMPCLATLVVMFHEFGKRDSLIVAVTSITLAFLLGGVAHFVLGVI